MRCDADARGGRAAQPPLRQQRHHPARRARGATGTHYEAVFAVGRTASRAPSPAPDGTRTPTSRRPLAGGSRRASFHAIDHDARGRQGGRAAGAALAGGPPAADRRRASTQRIAGSAHGARLSRDSAVWWRATGTRSTTGSRRPTTVRRTLGSSRPTASPSGGLRGFEPLAAHRAGPAARPALRAPLPHQRDHRAVTRRRNRRAVSGRDRSCRRRPAGPPVSRRSLRGHLREDRRTDGATSRGRSSTPTSGLRPPPPRRRPSRYPRQCACRPPPHADRPPSFPARTTSRFSSWWHATRSRWIQPTPTATPMPTSSRPTARSTAPRAETHSPPCRAARAAAR